MTHVLLDTNILLDVFCERHPFFSPASEIWTRVESGEFRASVSAHSITTIYCIASKHLGPQKAIDAVRNVLQTFSVCPVDVRALQLALNRAMSDYEDAVLDAAAELAGIPMIVTRNVEDFSGATRRIVDSVSFLKELIAPGT